MTALHKALPDLVPKPLGFGILSCYKNGVSPDGKFGFPVPTYQGRLSQDTTQCDTWEESFSRGIEQFFRLEEELQGYDEEMAELRKGIMEKVIPRLLRSLETEGRKVVPRLVHGDLWDGNTSADAATGLPIIFDACSSYAHHEYELAPWRPTRHKIGKPQSKVDREDLCRRFNLCSSALYPGNIHFRNIVKEMRELVNKFPLGYEGYEQEQVLKVPVSESRVPQLVST
ncbi:hypothetical protein AJ79_06332 [Helicocarpus griseus UAMH5409]|uniref:protein-ribulosamine 3-kinase n=1 Tax=Helicocarpus griseus UAMH5409 TaxID=1447875 RepID=A0A2B7XEZ3_9EURO|nr:hypothetical protein AJ79_06332 [Helicocarpus griseus UAMH5409]